MNAPQIVIPPTTRAARVQHVVSKAGIEAWLVEDYAVPLVAMACVGITDVPTFGEWFG